MAKEKLKIEYLGECELDEKTSALVDRMTAEADAELDETRICFRWGKEQLDIVKRAANAVGVPYQTFLKLAVYEHAIEVLKNATVATPKDAA
jgi:predicted DNA binding CopG/RHH family protein